MSSASPHIFTLTGNLLAERTLEFDSWSTGRTQRAVRESFQVGGKGINVAKMLARLGAPTTALCFAGGPSGQECETWLATRGFSHRVFRTTVPTRTGTVVRTAATSPAAQPETTFLGPDAAPDVAAIRNCAAFLDAQPAGQVLAVCGSLPGWNSPDLEPLRAAFCRWIERGHLAVDTYGPPLAWLASQRTDLVKINALEFATVAPPDSLRPPGSVVRWIVTDGPAKVRVWDGPCQHEFAPPKVTEISPTGSGDVLFACVLHALYREGSSLDAAVQFALPYAAANAAHPGIAEFPEPPAA
jgi:fructose-1-phosphate kinase PfkB-like protein